MASLPTGIRRVYNYFYKRRATVSNSYTPTPTQIKEYFESQSFNAENITEEEFNQAVNHFSKGELSLEVQDVSNIEELSNSSEIVSVSTNDELSHTQKQTLIQQVASTLEVNLSVDQVKKISQKMDWSLSDRTLLKDRIQSAIVAWIDYQIEQDKQQTDDMMQEVEEHLVTKLQESNQHFDSKAREFSNRIEEAREKFRATETELLDLFKIPS